MESLIKSLRDHGIHISVEADNLKVNFDGAQIPSDLLAQLKEHKMELMAHLRAIGAGSEYVPIPKIDDESNRYLLSSAQKRLWIASQIPSASVSYNMPFSAELPEAYSDLAILRESVAHVVDRHESLRTVFKMDKEGEVYQTILSSESIPQEIDFVDLSDSENAEQELSDYIKTDAIKPFDLECGPLFRMSCFKVSASRYHLYYNLHHIITDEWSMEVLRGDIFAAYEMIKAGKTPQLSPLKIQYKDYASWQLKSLESEAMDASATYWKQVLEGEIVPQGLPSHRSRPSRKTNNGKRIRTFLGTEVTNSLKRLTQEQGGSLFMLLLSSFKVLLSHYSGQRDIWIGSPVAGRDHADLENQIGFYLNTLVLRNFVDHDATFAEFYETVKKNVLDAFSHQMYPFDRLLEDLNVSRDLSRNPLFDLLLDYHKSVDIEIDEGLTGRINDLGEKPAKFDIEIHFTELPEHLGITVDYNTDVYQDDIIFQFVDQFTHFLSNLEGCFENRISELQLVTEKERKKILERSKGVPMVEAEDETVLGMFSKTAVDYPTRQVVSLFDEHLDYETLDRWSTCLAQKLVGELNMSPGTHIGIKMDHSPLLMVAILGVLKAGCAFVPIDPSYTSEREQYIIDDAAIGLLITTTAFIFDYSEADFALLSIDVEFDAISVDQGIQLPEVDGATLAYVIYTSGSTGTPKGVMIEHASLNNYLNWAKETYLGNALSNNDFGLFTSISFDLTITSMFLPLITGGTLKMQGNDRDVVQVLNDYANSEISCIKLTPAHIGVLASLEMEQTTIELAIVGGDVLTGQQVIELQRLNPNIKIYNEYGPTEATVGCIVKEVINPSAITIGTPIANMEAYVLNSELKPVPNHVIGELYLGGRGLSKGYLNRPELTAEKFVKHPFIPDQVLYRSGDLAHWTTNGELQFNGRRDHQVKIKGFRIELGEIEYHLNQHHKVNHAVVLVTENSQDRYLEAYLTGTTDLNVQELRSYLSQQLPDYMIPLEFHSLEAFPLNKNGKIDTAQLRNINNKIDATAASYVAPRNDTEREIAAIWKEEFNLDQVSIETSFFDLGGDSIRAIRVLSKMNKVLGQKLEVADIFEHPSIQELIENTERPDDLINDSLKHEISERLDAYREEAVTVEGVQDAYPMSDIEIGMCYSYIANQGTGVYHDQFVYPVDLSGFDRNVFKKALDLMIQKHEVMRAAYELDKFSVPMRLIYETVEPKIEYSSITNLNAAEQQKHIEDFMSKERSDSHFDCTTPGMWKMTIFELSEQQHFMVFQFHHAIIDGWSRASFITELNNTYYQMQKDDEFLPEALEIGYKDFILEQEYLKASTQVDDFWRSYLSDYERLSCFTETIERENTMTRIDGPLYERLVAFCARNEVKLQTVLHTAYLFTLSRLSYESDLLTGYITSGRPVAERGDEIAGCFLNTVPFRCEIGNESLLQLVRKVEAGLTSLKRFENLSLAELQARFSSEANSENPFFDSFFNFTDFHIYEDALTSDGAPSETLDVGNFELTNTYLDVSAAQGEDRISVYWTRKRALSSHKTNQDLSSIFLAFVDQLLAQPNEPLAAVSYLTSEEQTLLDALTQTTVALPEEETFLDLFRARTEEQPESTAVIFNGTVLTYTELDQLSTQFASYLIKEHNIKPGAIVGIELPRNEWLIVVMLGIIKAGAAYVPLDKNYPQKRKDFIAQDTQYVLCANEIIVEDFRAKLAKFESNQLEVAVSPGDLAYIIYTSGSTGVPKGVLLRHSNLYSLLHQLDVQYGYEDAEKIAVTTNITFDISVLEIFGGLSQGKTLVVFGDDDLENDISRFISKLQKEAVDVLQATPTRFGLIKEAVFGGELPDLRHLILGGEPIPQSIFEKLASNPSLNAINGYGPTETTVYSSYKKLTDAPEVTIGKPLHNEQLYILNSHLQRQGVGVVGELCISGRGLSSGYLNRPEITAERFVPNPFQPGEMLYKTGDLARILPSGEVDYVGRNDDQVKIRGIRIELQDIEHQLGTHPLIDSVVVLAAAVTDGKELVAFITSEENIEAEDLRAYLMEQLPQYMIPSRFVQVAAIPRSHSGKVDRKKLLEMNRIEMETVVDVEPPKDEMEAGLLDIWKVLLEKEHLGVTDDFFVVGGNSLKAISFLGKVNQTYSVEITLADLFKYSNIRELAVCVQNKKWLDDATEIENENEVIL